MKRRMGHLEKGPCSTTKKYTVNLSDPFPKWPMVFNQGYYALEKRKYSDLSEIAGYWLWTDTDSWRTKMSWWSTNQGTILRRSDGEWGFSLRPFHSGRRGPGTRLVVIFQVQNTTWICMLSNWQNSQIWIRYSVLQRTHKLRNKAGIFPLCTRRYTILWSIFKFQICYKIC